jgi:hypothetical protein
MIHSSGDGMEAKPRDVLMAAPVLDGIPVIISAFFGKKRVDCHSLALPHARPAEFL